MAVTAPRTTARIQPVSQHVADSSVQPFLKDDFDPVDYLNSTLPALSTTSRPSQSAQHGRAVPLSELNAQLQTQLSQVNAQMTRLSNTLTQLTDDIIRSGGRLAYEVEVLRGDTTGLTDVLENGLKEDIELLAPKPRVEKETSRKDEAVGASGEDPSKHSIVSTEPEYLEKLRTLTAVRSRLDAVIKVFGDAMAWPLASSEFSLASSLISVSAPESEADSRDREAKGKQYIESLRTEINELVGSGNDQASLAAAAARIDDLRTLAEVWKGTAEEKPRMKVVDNLQKPIEDRQRALERAGQARKPAVSPARGADLRYGNSSTRPSTESGYGFLQNLRNLKNEMYLE
ncbi:hypothetical protein LTR10_000923 [Elasticomyces elasticus]|nr:hypothetical protein LTR10_000923 [Elasticomyces elasticus]KAK4979830.1 hypothetical protein LTR42_000137 [Elasticomyces elasticus]